MTRTRSGAWAEAGAFAFEPNTSFSTVTALATLVVGFEPLPWTLWKDVYRLPPGGGLQTQGDEPTPTYAHPRGSDSRSSEVPTPPLALDEVTASLHEILLSDLRRFKCKKVGVALSGGKDSAYLLASAREAGLTDLHAFTYADRRAPEAAAARSLAEVVGVTHSVVSSSPGDHWRRLKKMYSKGLYSVDLAVLPYLALAEAAARSGCSAILDGLGNDVYLGVPWSRSHKVRALLARLGALGAAKPAARVKASGSLVGRCLHGLTWTDDLLSRLPGARYALQTLRLDRPSAAEAVGGRIQPLLSYARTLRGEEQRSFLVSVTEAGASVTKVGAAARTFGLDHSLPLGTTRLLRQTVESGMAGSIGKEWMVSRCRSIGMESPYFSRKSAFLFDAASFLEGCSEALRVVRATVLDAGVPESRWDRWAPTEKARAVLAFGPDVFRTGVGGG